MFHFMSVDKSLYKILKWKNLQGKCSEDRTLVHMLLITLCVKFLKNRSGSSDNIWQKPPHSSKCIAGPSGAATSWIDRHGNVTSTKTCCLPWRADGGQATNYRIIYKTYTLHDFDCRFLGWKPLFFTFFLHFSALFAEVMMIRIFFNSKCTYASWKEIFYKMLMF